MVQQKNNKSPAYEFISILINDEFFKSKRCLWGPKGKTFFAPNKKLSYQIDFFDENDKIGILYYTDYIHACHNRYRDTDLINIDGKEITALEIRQRDEARKKYMEEEYGIKLYIVWEGDYLNNKEKTIKELFNKIMEDI